MANEIFIKKYGLNDFFTSIFSMFKYTWKDTLILSLIFFIPSSIVFYFGFTKFANVLVDFAENMNNMESINNPEIFFQYMPDLLTGYSFLIGALALYGLAKLFVSSFVSLKTYKKANNEDIYFNENFVVTLTKKFPKLILQSILIGLVFSVIIVIFYVILIVPIILFSVLNLKGMIIAAVLFDIIFAIGFIVFMVWFSVKFTFSQYPIICNDSKIFEGIKRSFYLIKGNFWRVLGICLLISLILSFTISIITGPIYSVGIMPSYVDFLKNMMNGGNTMEAMADFYKSFANLGPIICISIIITGVAESLILPIFMSLFYIDLRVRRNEMSETNPITQPDNING